MSAALPLTIAIPTFNRGGILRSLLLAIRAQALPEDELLVSDDGSNDQTAEVVHSVPPFRLLRQDVNLGMVGNWNACLEAASHPWICLIHDDDELMPNGLALLRRACAIANGPALVACQSVGIELDTALRYRHCDPGAWAAWHCPTIPSGAIVHRNVVASLGGFDPRYRYSADLEYFGRICTRFPSVVIQSPTVVRYHIHDDNYQFKTWRQPDFLSQFIAIQRAILDHAGVHGTTADRLLDERVTATLRYMLGHAGRRGDRNLAQEIAWKLWRRSALPWRVRVAAAWSALVG